MPTTPVEAKFDGEELTVVFHGTQEHYEEGDLITEISVEDLIFLCHNFEMKSLPDALQASILALADDLDWKPRDE
jgi:hypothetical protein